MLEILSETFATARLQAARSDFLDSFADIETRITTMLEAKGASGKSIPFGNRLEQFRKLAGIPQIAKPNAPQLDAIVDSIAALLPIRADIVHSRMTILNVGGEPVAQFVNAQHRHHRYPTCRLVSIADFAGLAASLMRIDEKIVNLSRINPPSSPPPPLPDAASGP